MPREHCNWCNNHGIIWENRGEFQGWIECPFCADTEGELVISPSGLPKRIKDEEHHTRKPTDNTTEPNSGDERSSDYSPQLQGGRTCPRCGHTWSEPDSQSPSRSSAMRSEGVDRDDGTSDRPHGTGAFWK